MSLAFFALGFIIYLFEEINFFKDLDVGIKMPIMLTALFVPSLLYKMFPFVILASSEIAVRYSGNSWNHTAIYYLLPIGLLPFVYFFLIRAFKYENLD